MKIKISKCYGVTPLETGVNMLIYSYLNRNKIVTNRNSIAVFNSCDAENRNTNCYGNRNKMCYTKYSVSQRVTRNMLRFVTVFLLVNVLIYSVFGVLLGTVTP